MKRSLSLRARLTFVILVPLMIIATVIGFLVYNDAQTRASERFDRSLLSTALSISRDIAVTGGDAPSEATRDLLRDTSGGAVFYHVYAPDGVFVTGYATPPIPPVTLGGIPEQTYYDAVYRSDTVRALRFTQTMSIENINGPFTFTVWQNTNVRDGFVSGRTGPTFIVIAFLIGALALVVWFGVGFGLSPLRDLENAIARRSTNDLSPIKRRIPIEVGGIVGTLNTLLGELGESLSAKDRFISDAAHQLRNPIAGVLGLAEAVHNAKTPEDVKTRSADLVEAARQSSTLANNLLTLERARAAPRAPSNTTFDPNPLLSKIAHDFAASARQKGVAFTPAIQTGLPNLKGDAVMFEQAILNLLNNALMHGGSALSNIALTANATERDVSILVQDDGRGIAQDDLRTAMARFGQIEPSVGSGLGLPIAMAVAEALGGKLVPTSTPEHFSVAMVLPAK